MGCSSSSNVHPSIYNETIRKQDHPNGALKPKKAPVCVNEKSLRGDYTQYQLAKHNREKGQKDRQIKIFMAADEMSGKMMEEREMLSLGTRSRGTSRNTSRATSPNNNRRSIQFKDEQINPMTPVAELSRGASLRSLEVGNAENKENEDNSQKKKHKSRKHSKTKGKSKKHKKSKKSKKGKDKALTEINESENEEPDSGLDDNDEDDDNEVNVDKVKGENNDTSVIIVKSEPDINRIDDKNVTSVRVTSSGMTSSDDTRGASTSVISKRSVNDIGIHSASEDSGIVGTVHNNADQPSGNEHSSKSKAQRTSYKVT